MFTSIPPLCEFFKVFKIEYFEIISKIIRPVSLS